MARLNGVIDFVVFYFLVTALTLLVVICFAQVVARYVFGVSFSWAEEVSICLMIWATWAGASIAMKRGNHLRVLIGVEKMSEKTRLILQVTLNSVGVIFLGLVAFTSRTIIDGMANATFFSLSWVPLNTMYVSVPVGCVLMIYYTVRSVAADWKVLRAQLGKEG
jgi:TRAP-type C4-dicarboxylate transport system permease small subunit